MHDMGGRQGFGKVRYTLNAEAFHAPWEIRVNSINSFAVRSGLFNMDEYRHAIERMEPRHYLAAGYYERMLTALVTLCVEKGVATREELEKLAQGSVPLSSANGPGRSNAAVRQRFRPGDKVRVRADHVPGHVRMPGYVRGKVGVVVAESPAYPFPDAHAHGVPAEDEPTYDVRFCSQDLWPDSSDPAQIHVGLFQSYLEPA
jgi:nitrile hydratase